MVKYKIGTHSDKKISKMGVIMVEPPYHAKVWEYSPVGPVISPA